MRGTIAAGLIGIVLNASSVPIVISRFQCEPPTYSNYDYNAPPPNDSNPLSQLRIVIRELKTLGYKKKKHQHYLE